MKPLRCTALVMALLAALPMLPAQAGEPPQNVSGDPMYTANAPRAFSMAGDLLIARPLLIAATAVGTGLFVVTLPFSALGGNVGEAADALIAEPGREAFARCLGCTSSQPQPAGTAD